MLFRRANQKAKVFCVGFNKTGTTSLGVALQTLNYKLGKQVDAERLLEEWARGDFRRILKYCRSAEAFQDVPFSLPNTYETLDEAFPNSKFILTLRNSPEEWYNSLVRFHTRIIGKDRLPTASDLKAFPYCQPGWLWKFHSLGFGVDEGSVFRRDHYLRHYEAHSNRVQAFFRNRPESLMVLNVGQPDAMDALCAFLGLSTRGLTMPHLKKTDESRPFHSR